MTKSNNTINEFKKNNIKSKKEEDNMIEYEEL